MDISCLSSQLKRSNLTSCLIYHLLLSVLDPSIETWENSFCFFWLMSHHNATMILKTVVEVSVSELHSFVWNHWKRNIYKFDTGISLFYTLWIDIQLSLFKAVVQILLKPQCRSVPIPWLLYLSHHLLSMKKEGKDLHGSYSITCWTPFHMFVLV